MFDKPILSICDTLSKPGDSVGAKRIRVFSILTANLSLNAGVPLDVEGTPVTGKENKRGWPPFCTFSTFSLIVPELVFVSPVLLCADCVEDQKG